MNRDTAQALLASWKDERAVDHHCHPLRRWPFQLTALELRSAFTEALDPELAERHVLYSAGYQAALHRIALVLGCEPTEAAVLDRRNRGDSERYTRRLLDQPPTEVMLVDAGFSSPESFTLAEQERATGIAQREIIRLETLAEALVKTANDPREWLAATRAALREGINRGAVGVKTICAYRASLKLQPVDTETLGAAFSALRLRAERDARPLSHQPAAVRQRCQPLSRGLFRVRTAAPRSAGRSAGRARRARRPVARFGGRAGPASARRERPPYISSRPD